VIKLKKIILLLLIPLLIIGDIGVVIPTQTMQAYKEPGFYKPKPYGTVDSINLSRKIKGESTILNDFFEWANYQEYKYDVFNEHELNESIFDYAVMIFPGHTEYVTREEVNLLDSYVRNGGNLIFLSANNFYAEVSIEGNVMSLQWDGQYRDSSLLRNRLMHESEFIGNEFNDMYLPNSSLMVPYVVKKEDHWIFEGTGLKNGDEFGKTSHESDRITRHTPRSTIRLASATIYPPWCIIWYNDGRSTVVDYCNPNVSLFTLIGEILVEKEVSLIEKINIILDTIYFRKFSPNVPYADMVITQREKGQIFAVGVYNWNTQMKNNEVMSRITKNVIDRFSK
jgi:hypothetical protein